MPIYRQLFDFLCLASIAISVPKTEPAQPKPGERVDAPIFAGTSASLGVYLDGMILLTSRSRRGRKWPTIWSLKILKRLQRRRLHGVGQGDLDNGKSFTPAASRRSA